MAFHLSSVWVAEWPPFGKELPIQLAVCSHSILSICNVSYFPFGFESGVWILMLQFLVIAYLLFLL